MGCDDEVYVVPSVWLHVRWHAEIRVRVGVQSLFPARTVVLGVRLRQGGRTWQGHADVLGLRDVRVDERVPFSVHAHVEARDREKRLRERR